MVHYTDRRSASAALAHALTPLGWKLYGYRADNSDAMTDYYYPPSWTGCATHDDCPGMVLAIDACQYDGKVEGSGKVQTKRVEAGTVTCSRCDGKQYEPGLKDWPLSRAQQDPQGFHKAEAAVRRLHGDLSVSLITDVVSPIGFLGQGWGAGIPETNDIPDDVRGLRRCSGCCGRGKTSTGFVDKHVCTWPEFGATPRGRMVHLEMRGRKVASWTGWSKLCGHGREAREAAEWLATEITAMARGIVDPHAAMPAQDATETLGGATVTDGKKEGFVDLTFSAKPPPHVRAALKEAGFRWSGRFRCWYGRRDRLPVEATA